MSIQSLVRSALRGAYGFLAGVRPYLQFTNSGSTASARVAQYQDGSIYLTSNLYTPDGSTWYLDDITQNGGFLILNRNFLQFYTAVAGANPRTLTQIFSIDGNGNASFYSQPGARVYNSMNQSIPDITLTTLTFDSEDYDIGGMHSTSSNTSRLTVPALGDGRWLAIANAQWAANGVGAREIYVTVNGTAKDFHRVVSPSGTLNVSTRIVTPLNGLVAGDYVEFKVFQNSGGALNVASLLINSSASLIKLS